MIAAGDLVRVGGRELFVAANQTKSELFSLVVRCREPVGAPGCDYEATYVLSKIPGSGAWALVFTSFCPVPPEEVAKRNFDSTLGLLLDTFPVLHEEIPFVSEEFNRERANLAKSKRPGVEVMRVALHDQ